MAKAHTPLRRHRLRLPSDLWASLAAVVVLAVARWMESPSTAIVALVVFALMGLAVITYRGGRNSRWRRIFFCVIGGVFVFVAAAFHRGVGELSQSDSVIRAERSRAGGEALAGAFAKVDESLDRIARQALLAPDDRDLVFAHLSSLLPSGSDKAVVTLSGGQPYAWSGRLLVPVDSLNDDAGIVATPFYIVAYRVARSDEGVTAVATALIHAERPADRLSSALDVIVAEESGVEGFLYGSASVAANVPDAVLLSMDGEPVLAAQAVVASSEVLMLRHTLWALRWVGLVLAALVLTFIAVAWRFDTGIGSRFVALAVAFAALAMVPLNAFSNVSPVFDPTFYYVPEGWRFTANVAALAITCSLLLMALLTALRARVELLTRTQALLGVIVVAGIGPFLLRQLARGIQVPGIGVPVGLWMAWQATLFLAAVTVLLFGVTTGQVALGARRGLAVWVAPVIAVIATLAAPVLLEAPGRFPPLYPAIWVAAIGALAFTRRAQTIVLPVAFVAACGAVTLVWLSSVRDRVDLARRDVQGLSTVDQGALVLIQRYADVLDPRGAARSRVEILTQFASSDLASADYPTEIITWSSDGRALAELRVGRGPGATYGGNIFALEARRRREPILREFPGEPGVMIELAVPHNDGTVTTLVVAPRTRLVTPDPYSAFLGFAPPPAPEPPYTLRIGDAAVGSIVGTSRSGTWVREGDEMHGDWILPGVGGSPRRVHAIVDLRTYDALVVRGAILVLFDLLMLGVVWLLIVIADGAAQRWWRIRRRDILKSYRTRLTVTLFACFLLPSVLFALWSFQRLQSDDEQARDLLVRETLRGIAVFSDSVELVEAAARFETPLFLYEDGMLIATSDPVLDALAPVGRLLPQEVLRDLVGGAAQTAGGEASVGPAEVRFGYRMATDAAGVSYVLAAPARMDERLLDRRRNDLALFLLFALAIGALAALWASGFASRALSRPIRELRDGALAIARGERDPLLTDDPPLEFETVFSAFKRMTSDLVESRSALEAAERRLATTLSNVASGVIAVDGKRRITFFNPRAELIIGRLLSHDTATLDDIDPVLARIVEDFRDGSSDDQGVELELMGRRLQLRMVRLARNGRSVVVTLDDVTEVTRAERVLAWGEMARQVAHEIKNPLTPMRLGMQHLRRAWRDKRVEFNEVLEENTARVLAEIDRLDEIARAFSKYGTAPVEDEPPEVVDLSEIVADVLEFERMGGGGVKWEAELPADGVHVSARERELREVLLNLLENSRLAGSTSVKVRITPTAEGGAELTVTDDGDGIPAHLLNRIFEPHFSTRTSGSGLGLAISRRLIESWGGTIIAERGESSGAILRVILAPPRVN